MLFHFPAHAVDGRIHRHQRLKSLKPPGPDELVRIHALREIQHPGRQLLLLKNLQRPKDRVLSGAVAVIADPDLRHHAPDQLGLLGGQGRAQGGAHPGDPGLPQGDHIHVPFGQDDAPQPLFLAEKVCGVDAPALVEHRGVPGVDVFPRVLVQRPAAKAQHLAAPVDDGEHGPAAEELVDAPLPAPGDSG